MGRSKGFVGIFPSAGDNIRYRHLLYIAGNGKFLRVRDNKRRRGGIKRFSAFHRHETPLHLARVCVSARFSDLSRRATLAQDLPKLSPSFDLGAAVLVPSS